MHRTSFVSAPINLALGRPTFMSEVRDGRGGSLAVDGNRSPLAEDVGSCAITEQTTYAWWAVDIGVSFNVKEVAISQRANWGKLDI